MRELERKEHITRQMTLLDSFLDEFRDVSKPIQMKCEYKMRTSSQEERTFLYRVLQKSREALENAFEPYHLFKIYADDTALEFAEKNMKKYDLYKNQLDEMEPLLTAPNYTEEDSEVFRDFAKYLKS